jgi:hypothetical protein
MSAYIKRNIPFLMTWVVVACMGARFLPAQSPSGSQAQTASAPAGGDDETTSDGSQKNSESAHGAASSMASQWTAGVKSFGPASDQSWGQKTTNFVPDSGTMWNPGTERFGVTAQVGGIWKARSVQSMRTQEPTPQNSSHRMNQSATGNPSQRTNPSITGNVFQRMNQLGSRDSSLIGSSDELPSNNWSAPSMAPWMKSTSTPEDAFQGLNQSTTGSRFSSSSSIGMLSITPQMKSKLLHSAGAIGIQTSGRTRSRRTLGSTSERGSSGVFSGRTIGNRGYASPSFGTGRSILRRALGSRSHLGSSRRSLSGSTRGERDYTSGPWGAQQTRTGLGGRMGEQDQRLEPRGLENNLSKRESVNGTHPVGNRLDSHRGLATRNAH